jgi:hypothetical protein
MTSAEFLYMGTYIQEDKTKTAKIPKASFQNLQCLFCHTLLIKAILRASPDPRGRRVPPLGRSRNRCIEG